MKVGQTILWGVLGLLVFAIAFITHLPAGFVIKQAQSQLPPGLVLSQSQGTIWQGQAQMQWQGQDLGRVVWDIHAWALLTAKLAADLRWYLAGESLAAEIEVGQNQADLRIPQGQINLTQAAGPWRDEFFFLRGLQGDVHFRDFATHIDFVQRWPQSVSGKIVVTDFNAMDIRFSQLDLTPSQPEPGQAIAIDIQAEESGWRLKGDATLTAPNRFQYQLELNADSAQSFPEWAGMMMRKTSDTQATAQKRGQW